MLDYDAQVHESFNHQPQAEVLIGLLPACFLRRGIRGATSILLAVLTLHQAGLLFVNLGFFMCHNCWSKVCQFSVSYTERNVPRILHINARNLANILAENLQDFFVYKKREFQKSLDIC